MSKHRYPHTLPHRSPTAYDTPFSVRTPASSSSSRKKRRRKTSQSESRKSHSASVVSPGHTPRAVENGSHTDNTASPEPTTDLASSPNENPFQKVKRKPRAKLLNRFDKDSPPKGRPKVGEEAPVVNGDAQTLEIGTSVSQSSEACTSAENQSPPKPMGRWNRSETGSSPPASQAGKLTWAGSLQ